MNEVRALRLVRAAYEAPALSVVAVRGGMLLSASPWTAEAFDDKVGYGWGDGPFEAEAFGVAVDYGWELSTAEGFDAPAAGFSWGGGPFEAEAFGGPVDCVWELSTAEGFGRAFDAWGGESSAEAFGDSGLHAEWDEP